MKFAKAYRSGMKKSARIVTLDNVAKVSAVVTPLLLGIGGWQMTRIAQERREPLDTYKETSSQIGTLSVSDVAKQRDILFSTMQLNRIDLVRRIAAYIDARISYELIKEENSIVRSTPNNSARALQIIEKRANFERIRQEVFEPLIVGALQSNEEEVAQAIILSVPGSASFRQRIDAGREDVRDIAGRAASSPGAGIPLSLLDFAVSAQAEGVVRLLLDRGVEPGFWTINRAISTRNERLLRDVLEKLRRNSAISFAVWSYAAKYATPNQIDIIASAGLANDTGTIIGESPILVQAAQAYRFDLIPNLVRAGFSPLRSSVDARDEIINLTTKSFESGFIGRTRQEEIQFENTIHALCQEYLRTRRRFSDLRSQFRFLESVQMKLDASVASVFSAILPFGGVETIDCLGEFYGLRRFSSERQYALLVDTLFRNERPARLLRERFGFPLHLVDAQDVGLAHIAAERNNPELLYYLDRNGVNLRTNDRNGRSLWAYAIDSRWSRISNESNVMFRIELEDFDRLVRAIVRRIPINSLDGRGWAPLHYAVQQGDFNKIRVLLEYQPPLNQLTRDGDSVLSLARNPELFIALYGLGARAPGVIPICQRANELTSWIRTNGSLYRPINATEANWDPESAVREAAKNCT
ncbi:hypothetical protein [Falsiroseomonas sp. HW251]|uniref:hypothetical protein n=1 Tax=Falsiroseomonas sp. HW251 TaxID=3390998 RepID=UPI003D313667